jgi:hypothetical protein
VPAQEYRAWLFRKLAQTHTRTAVVQGKGFELSSLSSRGDVRVKLKSGTPVLAT